MIDGGDPREPTRREPTRHEAIRARLSGEHRPQRRHNRSVGGQPIHTVQLVVGEPAQLGVLKGPRLVAVDNGREVDLEQGATVAQPHVAPDARADFYAYAQFLITFADQRLDLGLAGLHLAASELPLAGDLGRIRPFAREYAPTGDDRGADDHP
jgi:hypothetical protein